eukprot:12800649-Alexandrium_andersonii.AAC.1
MPLLRALARPGGWPVLQQEARAMDDDLEAEVALRLSLFDPYRRRALPPMTPGGTAVASSWP